MRQQDGYARASWAQRNPDAIWLLLVAPALVYLSIFFLYPVARIILRSVFAPEFTFANYARLLESPAYLRILWQTVRISLTVSLIALVVGYPAAVFLSRARGRTAGMLLALVLLPFWTSVLVRTYAWIVILGSDGVINRALLGAGIISQPLSLVYNEFAVVIGMVHVLLPYMILTLTGVMRGIDPVYLRAAANLGAGTRDAFVRVYLPLSMPGVTAGFLLVFILSMGFFITPALLGGGNVEMIALQIDAQISDLVDWGFGSALATLLFIIVIGLVLFFTAVFDVDAFGYGQQPSQAPKRSPNRYLRMLSGSLSGLRAFAMNSVGAALKRFDGIKASRLAPGTRQRGFDTPSRRHGYLALHAWTIAVLVFLVAPVLIIIPMSFGETAYLAFPPQGFTLGWYARYLEDGDWMAATGLSFRVALVTAFLSVLLGTLAAVGLVRGEYRAKRAVYLTVLAPLIVPVIVSAVAVYFVLVRMRLVGHFWAFVIAHVVLAIPVVVLVVSAALRRVNVALERAATILGATPARAFFEVTFPVLRPALISALLFAFITSFDEIVMALFLAGTSSATLPKRMWESLRFQIDPTIAAVSTLLVLLSLLILAAAAVLRRPVAK